MKYVSIITFFFLISCDNQNDFTAEIIEGTYRGTYTVINNYASDHEDSESGSVELLLEHNNYMITPEVYLTPPNSIGKYTLATSSIIFQDTVEHTANFDWTLIIAGEYQYKLVEDNLELMQIDSENNRKYIFDLLKE